jgi:hypothetical protein
LPFFDRLSPLQKRFEAVLFVPCSPFDDKTDGPLEYVNARISRFCTAKWGGERADTWVQTWNPVFARSFEPKEVVSRRRGAGMTRMKTIVLFQGEKEKR